MNNKNIILFGIGGSIGFVAGNLFLAGKIIESEKMRKALSDIICEKVDKLIFNDKTSRTNGYRVSYRNYSENRNGSNRVSYRNYSENRNGSNRVSYRNYNPKRHVTEEVIFDSEKDAEDILAKMNELIDTYGFVTIADYYDLCSIEKSTFRDNQYGWTNLDEMEVVHCRNGYFIKMPAAVQN